MTKTDTIIILLGVDTSIMAGCIILGVYYIYRIERLVIRYTTMFESLTAVVIDIYKMISDSYHEV
jgi:hypothetical protein